MDKKYIYTMVAVILTTLLEFDNWSPRTPIYMACNCDMDKFMAIENLLVSSGLITTTSETMKLTEKGIETAKELNKAITKK